MADTPDDWRTSLGDTFSWTVLFRTFRLAVQPGKIAFATLGLLLTFLVTRNPAWRHARVRVISLASSDLAREQTERQLDRLIPEARITAEVRVLRKEPEDSVAEIIQRESADAELVLLGLATPERDREAEYARRLETLAGDLPNVFFVKNASMFMGELIQTDDQEAAPTT